MALSQPKFEIRERTDNCAVHGDYTARNFHAQMWGGCPACSTEKAERDRAAEVEARRQGRLNSLLLDSGLAGRFRGATFDNFTVECPEQAKVLAICREYVQNFGPDTGGGLWLVGPCGTGKTHLGSAMVRAFIESRGMGAAIYSVSEIIRQLRATWGPPRGNGSKTEEDVINELGALPVLVIDEIGVGYGSEAEQKQLLDVVDMRYKHLRPTVILSNLTTTDLKNALQDRIFDRLREGAKLVPCNWASNRGAKDLAAMLRGVEWPEDRRGYI